MDWLTSNTATTDLLGLASVRPKNGGVRSKVMKYFESRSPVQLITHLDEKPDPQK